LCIGVLGVRKSNTMLFDPVINSLIDEPETHAEEGVFVDRICSHCHRKIIGKQYLSTNNNYYDSFCWQFRYVLEPVEKKKKDNEMDEEI
jgi:hypothetical protein